MQNPKQRQILCIDCAVFVGLIVNTVLYLLALNLYKDVMGQAVEGFFVVVYGVLFTNIIPEYLISLVSVPAIVLGVRRGLKLGILGNNWKKEEE